MTRLEKHKDTVAIMLGAVFVSAFVVVGTGFFGLGHGRPSITKSGDCLLNDRQSIVVVFFKNNIANSEQTRLIKSVGGTVHDAYPQDNGYSFRIATSKAAQAKLALEASQAINSVQLSSSESCLDPD